MKDEKKIKIYFKGDSGIKQPVDMQGNSIKEGDLLTRDYGDYPKYDIKVGENYHCEAFYKVKINEKGGFFAESIKPCGGILGEDKYYFLHDFRFKHCRIIKQVTTQPL